MTPTSHKGFSAVAGTCGDLCLPIYADTPARACGPVATDKGPRKSPQSAVPVNEAHNISSALGGRR